MNNKPNIIVVIPARGGSKGIPRKNIRALNNKPLIYYSIKTALKSQFKPTVVVTSDDNEILEIAKKTGAQTLLRDTALAGDKITLDSVIYDAYIKTEKLSDNKFDIIITLQPTSPLLKTQSLDNAVKIMLNKPCTDCVISVKDDTHLSWTEKNGKFIPNYTERLNRQYLTPIYTETGGFFITNAKIITTADRIGKNNELYILKGGEEIDIDTYEDWNICEYYLRRKTILFNTTGFKEIGLGHIYRSLIIANDILNHKLVFLTDKKSKAGFDIIKSMNYDVRTQQEDNILTDITKINPDIVINDILDTDEKYMKGLRCISDKIINFEDCGKGSKYADIIVNALYPEEKQKKENYFSGHNYFIARDEFILSDKKKINNDVKKVLITFGGTDPNNFTLKTLNVIYNYCIKQEIEIDVIAGKGYTDYSTLQEFKKINLLKDVKNISSYMEEADIVFSSAGRTVYEIAIIGTPAIIMCQNKRETTHLFAHQENGFINLGEGTNVAENELKQVFVNLINNFEQRKKMNNLMLNTDLKKGRRRVINIISNFINN